MRFWQSATFFTLYHIHNLESAKEKKGILFNFTSLNEFHFNLVHNLNIKFKFDLETLEKKRHLVECPMLSSHDFYHLILFYGDQTTCYLVNVEILATFSLPHGYQMPKERC